MAERYKTFLLFGAPGVGKGTQGKLLGQIPGFVHLATGDIFRSLDKQSPLGKKFVEYSSRGELVPDELTVGLWRDFVASMISVQRYKPATDLLVLDGIPRSLAQADALDQYIDVLGIVHITVPNIEEMVARMKRRALKEGRHDDADEDVIRRRFKVYRNETEPVLRSFDGSLITEVNGAGSPAEVLLCVLNAVVPIYVKHFGNPLVC